MREGKYPVNITDDKEFDQAKNVWEPLRIQLRIKQQRKKRQIKVEGIKPDVREGKYPVNITDDKEFDQGKKGRES